MIDLLIVAPSDEQIHNAPIGFLLTDEIFTQAGLKDHISSNQESMRELRRTVIYLLRRFPRRLRVQWVEPFSLRGLFIKIRFRLGAYPVILIFSKSETRTLAGEEINKLSNHVSDMLSKVVDI